MSGNHWIPVMITYNGDQTDSEVSNQDWINIGDGTRTNDEPFGKSLCQSLADSIIDTS